MPIWRCSGSPRVESALSHAAAAAALCPVHRAGLQRCFHRGPGLTLRSVCWMGCTELQLQGLQAHVLHFLLQTGRWACSAGASSLALSSCYPDPSQNPGELLLVSDLSDVSLFPGWCLQEVLLVCPRLEESSDHSRSPRLAGFGGGFLLPALPWSLRQVLKVLSSCCAARRGVKEAFPLLFLLSQVHYKL